MKWSLKPLLLASEISIRPVQSISYQRLLLVIYVLTLVLIVYSNSYFWLQSALAASITFNFWRAFQTKNPAPSLRELRIKSDKWTLISNNNLIEYEHATILIHNPLFQLIKLKNEQQSEVFVLFNDQLTPTELRLMHLQAD